MQNRKLTILDHLSRVAVVLLMVNACISYAQEPAVVADEDTTKSVSQGVDTSEDNDNKEEKKKTPLPLEHIRTFAEVFIQVKNNYVEEVTDEQLLDFAIEGMLYGLDPHSSYLKHEEVTELRQGTAGRFGGLGIEVGMEDGFVKVIAPIDDTPASRAGIQSGDLIIRIDGKSVSGISLNEAVDRMRGLVDTKIELTILRETENEPFDIELTRDVIQVKSVRGNFLDDDIAYIRLNRFQITTAELFRKQIKTLQAEKPIAGLILDLRNNPGGLLNSAVSVVDAFLHEGDIVSTKGQVEDNNLAYAATGGDLLDGAPVVVLINGGSASASEIVAGALQDHHRALVMGTQSFGKGSVQTVINVGEKDAIKLTTSRYYTPDGRSIQAQGIVPDIVVEQRDIQDPEKRAYSRIKESDLVGSLDNGQSDSKTSGKEDDPQLRDYQLQEALNLMKGMILYEKRTQSN